METSKHREGCQSWPCDCDPGMSDEELAEYFAKVASAKVANCGEAFAFKPSEVRLFIGNVEIVGFEGFGSVEVK